MNKASQGELFKEFSQFFKNKDNHQISLMGFGFCVGDGWTPLIKSLLHFIDSKYERFNQVVENNNRLISEGKDLEKDYHWIFEYFKENPSNPFEGFEVVQVKQKFGGLRFYTNNCPGSIHDVISFAEQLSYTICEDCGAPGEIR